MNAYYQNPTVKSHQTYYPEIRVGDRLISIICAIIAFFSSRVAIAIEKSLLCTVAFFGFFGVIGGMENGTISLALGLVLCLLLSATELSILRSMVRNARANKANK